MKCTYFGCENRPKQRSVTKVSFFSYPLEENLLREWRRRAGTQTDSKYARVCSAHFLPTDFCYRTSRCLALRPDAVPIDSSVYREDNWCHLCRRRPQSQSANEVKQCFGRCGSQTTDTAVADVLNTHFWFKLNPSNDADAYVCQPCWQKVNEFHRFYVQVQGIHHTEAVESVKQEQIDPIAIARPIGIRPDSYQSAADDHTYFQLVANRGEQQQQQQQQQPPTRHVINVKSIQSILQSPVPIAKPPVAALAVPPKYAKDAEMIAKYFTLHCDICLAPVRDLADALEHHRNKHQNAAGYLPCKCGKRFSDYRKMVAHCDFHADPGVWKCDECCLVFLQAQRLALHLKQKHAQRRREAISAETFALLRQDDVVIRERFKLRCDVCEAGVEYETYDDWRDHCRDEHGALGSLQCCGLRFQQKSLMVDHVRWHRDPQVFGCSICSVAFRTAAQLQQHEHGRTYECHHCHQPFATLLRLRGHINWNHQVPTHFCDHCPARYPSQTRLDAHYALKHTPKEPRPARPRRPTPPRPPPTQCQLCGKWLRLMELHLERCRRQPSQCAQCDHVAPNVAALRDHQRAKHLGQPPRPACICPVCGKQVSRQRLPEHVRMHADPDRRFACSWCPKQFRSAGNLHRHRGISHPQLQAAAMTARRAGEVEWRAARQQMRASNALAAHPEEEGEEAAVVAVAVEAVVVKKPTKPVAKKPPKQHRCILCPHVASNSFLLGLHMDKHTNSYRYKCEFCDKRFRMPSSLPRHRVLAHPELDRQRKEAALAQKERDNAEWLAKQAADSGLAAMMAVGGGGGGGGAGAVEKAAMTAALMAIGSGGGSGGGGSLGAKETAAMTAAMEAEAAASTKAQVVVEPRENDVIEDSMMWNFCVIEDE